MRFLGSNPKPKFNALEQLPGRSNYFIGNAPRKWRTRVSHFARVSFEDVFPQVDLSYYGNQGQLEYDFLLHPGSDPKQIRLAFSGERQLLIDATGALILKVGDRRIRFPRPVAYQDTGGRAKPRYIDCRYVFLGKNVVGFEIASFDRSQTLVIDPILSFATFLGGAGLDVGNSVAVDSSGIYVTGETSSVDFPTTAGAYQMNNAGASDVFVTKLDPTGTNLLYSTFIGGSLSERGSSIAVDGQGNACVTGRTNSPDYPTMNPWQTQLFGDFDAFVTQLSADGSALLFSTYLGGSGNDEGSGIAVDGMGAIYVTGGTSAASGDDFPTTQGAFQRLFGGGMNDAFVTKFDPSKAGPAALVYSTFLGGSGVDRGNSIAVDSSGNAYITGRTASLDFPTKNALQANHGGGAYDAFVTKVNSTGTDVAFSTFLGGAGSDQGYGIAVDLSSGLLNVYVVGVTDSSDFPTANAYQNAKAGGSDAFVAKLAGDGSSLLYSTYFGGSGADVGAGLALDSSGIAFITGQTSSAVDFPVSANAIQPVFAGGSTDAFVAKIDTAQTGTASLVYSSYLGGSKDENIASPGAAGNPSGGIAIDSLGNAYITGNTSSPDFPNKNSYQPAYGGDPSDAFVVKVTFTDGEIIGIADGCRHSRGVCKYLH